MRILRIALEYLREKQPPVVRVLHITILCLVLSQILVSNFMGFSDTGEVGSQAIEHFGTWIHIGTGLALLPLACLFIYVELKRHGIKYFFPYLYRDFARLKQDLQKLKRFEFPEPDAYGLAAIVQGLGLGALILVVLSGAAWFFSWVFTAPWAHSLKEVHEAVTGLIETYVVGHGGMGLLHLYFQVKKPQSR
jgi:cytochrome b561